MGFMVRPTEFEIQHAPAIFAGQAYAATHDFALPDTPMWRRLEHRYEVNPMRFGKWHPNLMLMFERTKLLTQQPEVLTQRLEVQASPLTTASVTPEPSSLCLWCVAIVATWVYRRVTR